MAGLRTYPLAPLKSTSTLCSPPSPPPPTPPFFLFGCTASLISCSSLQSSLISPREKAWLLPLCLFISNSIYIALVLSLSSIKYTVRANA